MNKGLLSRRGVPQARFRTEEGKALCFQWELTEKAQGFHAYIYPKGKYPKDEYNFVGERWICFDIAFFGLLRNNLLLSGGCIC